MVSTHWIRQLHRGLSLAFTAAVVVNIVAMIRQEQAIWIGLLALLPLILLLLSGLYLFMLPCMTRWRGKPRRAALAKPLPGELV